MVVRRPDVEKPGQTGVISWRKPAPIAKSSSILPKTLILSLQIAGEFPCRPGDTLNKYSIPWSIWSAIPVGFSVYFACSYAYISSGRFQVELKSLQFFKILEVVFRDSVLLCGSISAVVCLYKSRQIKQLFQILQNSVSMRTERYKTFIEMCCLTWQIVCVLGVVYSVQHTYYVIYSHSYPNWIVLARSVLAGDAHAPPLSEVFWTTFGKLCCSWQNIAPQMIILHTAVIIGSFWKSLRSDLSHIAKESVSVQPHMLRSIHKQYRDSHCILKKLNEAFSLIILVNCVGELIINVAIIAYLLRNEEGEGQQEDDIQRIVFGTIGTTNMVLKIFASIFCGEQARKMKEFLLDNFILSENGSDQAIVYAKDFHKEISNNCNALAGGGCFLLNTEYALTCSGLLLTYLLLVYQMRDGKNDNAELTKLIVNSTAVLEDKIDQLLRHVQKI